MNKQIFNILDKKFPGEFKLTGPDFIANKRNTIFTQWLYIHDAFWLAKKMGLFKNLYLTQSMEGNRWEITRTDHGIWKDHTILFRARTIQEVICKAVISIYEHKV